MRALVSRVLIGAHDESGAVDAAELDDATIDALGRRIGELDALSDMDVRLICPACTATWGAPFEPVSYVWSEVATIAQRLLRDVHRLAAAYGWSEADILAMSATRRLHYLALSA